MAEDRKRFTVAFYNLENYFDTRNDPHKLDDDFTPKGFKKWDDKRFAWKTKKLAKAISEIGEEETDAPPVLLGVAEIENAKVLEALLASKKLKDVNYDYVHFESPDERGIDTGLIYNADFFEVLKGETLPLLVENTNGERDFTRDILYVSGKLNGEKIHLFVNHWPSRRDGSKETEYKRVAAAATVLQKIELLKKEDKEPHIIVMGDFNDNPQSASIKHLMESRLFINPMEKLLSPLGGSANYKGEWSLFDQVLLSHSFLNVEKGTHSFDKAAIFAPRFLKEWKGKYKGNPYRTYAGRKYIGGYSDHFPVYAVLELKS